MLFKVDELPLLPLGSYLFICLFEIWGDNFLLNPQNWFVKDI